jgi:hypothetical protein
MGLSNNLSLLKDIETARGFALTGIEYRTKCFAKPKIKKNILHLQNLIKDNQFKS